MKHTLQYILLILTSFIVFSSCEDSDDIDAREPAMVSRTVLVYMAANNSQSLPHTQNFNAMVDRKSVV